MPKVSGVYVKVKILLKHHIEEDEVEDFLNECSYSIKHPFYEIDDTEWTDFEEIIMNT